MNTLVLNAHLVNRGITEFASDTDVRLLDLLTTAHRLIGALIVVTAVLLVATAGPRWRSRISAILVALFMVGVVAAGCAPAAHAATRVTTPSDGPSALFIAAGVAAVVAIGAVFLAALRVAFHVLAAVARALEIVFIARHAAAITGALALVLMVVVTRG